MCVQATQITDELFQCSVLSYFYSITLYSTTQVQFRPPSPWTQRPNTSDSFLLGNTEPHISGSAVVKEMEQPGPHALLPSSSLARANQPGETSQVGTTAPHKNGSCRDNFFKGCKAPVLPAFIHLVKSVYCYHFSFPVPPKLFQVFVVVFPK